MTIGTKPSKPTLAAVAQEAGVSTPTVSKVINGREDVADETRARVLAALQRTGYKTPSQRRSVPSRRAVEAVFDSLNSAYAVEVLNGVLEQAAIADMEVVLSVTSRQSGSPLGPEERAQRLIDEGRSGMIVVTSAFNSGQLNAFQRRRIPIVVVDPLNPPPGDVFSVGASNWAGGKAAAAHLLALGHRRIAYIGGPESAECSQARLHGYMAALMAEGISVQEEYVLAGPFRPSNGVQAMKSLLALDDPPTAIFAASDSIALGVLAEARRQNVRIPEELSLVGFDGTHQAAESVPPLTSVSQPLQDMGRSAVNFILRQMNGEDIDSRRVELATHLVVRESTAAPRPAAHLVVRESTAAPRPAAHRFTAKEAGAGNRGT
ncbi:LacI family DNA-binding transcriptional regulator [Paenarthrobacter ureafaciens]|uniref:LacI family DNA-binding transcriptional regulator n=1 Tax=Paenarthrobacter ureafaciens TaxID=37931 RepID=UPI000FEC82E1|nr:substrate-binding domain-containing protein [Paenarthrobacter ureafaciens]RWW96176.1 LacI family transcriptional regulator [Paenarthrobacter ureafaciens]